MTNIIYDETNAQILAIASAADMAHDLAESISYALHRNAIYGLFGIKLVSFSEEAVKVTPEADRFRAAFNRFMEGIR